MRTLLILIVVVSGCVAEVPPTTQPIVSTCAFKSVVVTKCADLKVGDRLDCDDDTKFIQDIFLKNFPHTGTNTVVAFSDETAVACEENNVWFSATEMSWGNHHCQVERCQ